MASKWTDDEKSLFLAKISGLWRNLTPEQIDEFSDGLNRFYLKTVLKVLSDRFKEDSKYPTVSELVTRCKAHISRAQSAGAGERQELIEHIGRYAGVHIFDAKTREWCVDRAGLFRVDPTVSAHSRRIALFAGFDGDKTQPPELRRDARPFELDALRKISRRLANGEFTDHRTPQWAPGGPGRTESDANLK